MTSLDAAARTAAGRIGPGPAVAPPKTGGGAWFWRVSRAAWHVVIADPLLFFGGIVLMVTADLIGLYTVQLLSTLTSALSGKSGGQASSFFGGWLEVPKEPETVGWLFLGLVVLIVVLRSVQRVVAARSENQSLVRLRLELHDRLLMLGPDYHKDNSPENLAMLVTGGAQSANQMFRQLLASPITQIIPLATAIWFIYENVNVMKEQNGLVLAVLFLMLLLLPVLGWIFAKRVDRAFGVAGALSGKLTTELFNSLSKPEEIQLMDAVPQREQAYKTRLDEQAKAQTVASAGRGLASQIEDAVQPLMQAAFLVYGAYAAVHDHDAATAGAIVGLYLFVPNAINPLKTVVDLLAGIGGAHSSLESLLVVLEAKPATVAEGVGRDLAPADRTVSLRDVVLSHGGAAPVLDDVSLEFAAGKITSVVGHSGAGKSTVLNVVAGLTRPDRGTVLIGGKNVNEIATHSLRHNVVKVSQDPLLMTAPVRENFRLVKADATDAEIEQVCRRTGLWDILVKHQPAGNPLDFVVVQKSAIGFSGGERRLLAVTRALLLHPTVLLLDEPTTGLDAAARKSLSEIVAKSFKDTTVILVDHNMEFVKQLADQVCCLDHGKITSAGPPQELLARSSLFAELMQDELYPMPTGGAQTRPLQEWVALVKAAESAGEFLMAFDLAKQALVEFPSEVSLRYLAVRTLARSGATQLAASLYDQYRLSQELDDDTVALRARILKDEAWQATGDARVPLLRKAAEAYADVFRRSPKYYQGINAATLFTLAGDTERAAPLIDGVAKSCDEDHPTKPLDIYYLEATRAELALLRGDTGAAEAALVRAMPPDFKDWAAMATTRRQLLEICRSRGLPADALKPLNMPRIVHYIGHMIAPPGAPGRFPADQEKTIAAGIADYLAKNDIRVGYGSLACGADILFAEALLARAGELNVVLPFELDEFKNTSVLRGGEGWGKRFDDCLARAKSVRYGTEDKYLGDDSLFSYATRLAMGLAILRAQNLGAEVNEVAVWDGVPSAGIAGTTVDIAYWRGKGRRTDVIPVVPSPGFNPAAIAAAPAPVMPRRQTHAMLFGDFHGYSTLRERDVPVFQQTYMAAIAEVLAQFDTAVQYRNTWGDAIYIVMGGAVDAARCALAIQARLAKLDHGGLPIQPELRLAGHFGPTFEGYDAVRREPTFFGAQVTRAARMEPVTPSNQVYVTEPFAAALLLENATEFSCEYVGQLPAAKNYGTMRMHMLRSVA